MSDPSGGRPRLALFDLDKTIIDCNSGRSWLRSEWRNGTLGMRDVAWASWWLFRYSLGHVGMANAYRDAVRTLEGQEEAGLAERTRQWFADDIAHRARPGALEAIRLHREAGDLLVLATSSSPYAARAALLEWGFDDAICTEFEVLDGVFTGEILSFAYGDAKAERVREWARGAGHDLAEAAFYTDSYTDLALLELVGRPVAVHPDRRLARLASDRGWEIADWGVSSGKGR